MLSRSVYRKLKKLFPRYNAQLAYIASKYVNYSSQLFYPLKANAYKAALNKIFLKHKNCKASILYPSPVGWDFALFQRPHHFASAFSDKNYLVFFLLPFVDVNHTNGFNKVGQSSYTVSLDAFNCFKEYYVDYLLITPKIDMAEIVKKIRHHILIYDYIDDLSVWQWGDSSHGETNHKIALEKADLIIASATSLYNEIKVLPKSTLLCPNGVDYKHFATKPILVKKKDRIFFKSLKKPIVGYYGALESWIDFNLIKNIAVNNTDKEIILIGIDPDKYLKKTKLDKQHNIHFIGPRKYKVLPWFLHNFDITIIPFKTGAISNSTSPLKLFEYMAAGKPVVTTYMPECEKYKGVLVSKTYKEFNINIKRAMKLKNNKRFINMLKKEAKNNTWEKRVDSIIEVMNGLN